MSKMILKKVYISRGGGGGGAPNFPQFLSISPMVSTKGIKVMMKIKASVKISNGNGSIIYRISASFKVVWSQWVSFGCLRLVWMLSGCTQYLRQTHHKVCCYDRSTLGHKFNRTMRQCRFATLFSFSLSPTPQSLCFVATVAPKLENRDNKRWQLWHWQKPMTIPSCNKLTIATV